MWTKFGDDMSKRSWVMLDKTDRQTDKPTNEHTCQNCKFWQVMKGQSEIANMPKFNNNILENSQTLAKWLETKHNSKGGALYHWQHWCKCGKIQSEWHLISLVSSEFLTYLKNILFLLDILAIIRFLFHQCSSSITRAIILIIYFDLLILKHAIRLRSLLNFTDTMGLYFYTLCENFK